MILGKNGTGNNGTGNNGTGISSTNRKVGKTGTLMLKFSKLKPPNPPPQTPNP